MTLVDELADEVLNARPRVRVDSTLGQWAKSEGLTRRLIQATGRLVDDTHRPAVTILPRAPYRLLENELARPYLWRLHAAQKPRSGMGAKRIPWRDDARKLLDVNPPLYFAEGGPHVGEWSYVDLTRAYPSIYEPLALDLHFRPDEELPRLGVGRFEFLWSDELAHARHLHRAIGGIIRATELHRLDYGVPTVIRDTWKWSPFFAPDLWGVITYTLHALARVAIDDLGAVMVNKDCYVVPRANEAAAVELCRDWGFDASVKAAGKGTIHSCCSWKIGRKKTVNLTNGFAVCQLLDVPRPVVRLLRRVRFARL